MEATRNSLKLTVVKETGVIFYGDCKSVFVPCGHETVAILPLHTPMIMKLSKGEIIAQEGHAKKLITKIEKGVVYVGDNEVRIIVDV